MTSPDGIELQPDRDPWAHLVLPANVKEQLSHVWRAIRDAGLRKRVDSHGFNTIIFGSPGTGKTEVGKGFDGIDGTRFFKVWPMDLRGQYIGQSGKRVRDVFSKARNSAPSVICMDLEQGPSSDDCMLSPRGSSDFVSQEIVLEMLPQLDELRTKACPVFIIVEAFHVDHIDPAVAARFDIRIEIPLPDDSASREILRRTILTFPRDPALDVDEISAVLARRLRGKSGRYLHTIVRDAMVHAQRAASDPSSARLDRELLLGEAPCLESGVYEQFDISAQARKQLENIGDILRHSEELKQQQIVVPRVLLSGPPSIDKGQIVRALAAARGVTVIEAHICDLKGKSVEQSLGKLRDLFERAKTQAPCILFIDDIDSLAEAIDNRRADYPGEIIFEIFAQLRDGARDSIVVASTTDRQKLHLAVLARFSLKIDLL